MEVFNHECYSAKNAKNISTSCGLFFFILSFLLFLCLRFNLPFDIVSSPLLTVKIITLTSIVAYFVFSLYANKNIDECRQISKLKNVVTCCSIFILVCLTFHFMAIMFGAPILANASETFHFALLVTSLSVAPGLVLLGVDSETWIRVFPLGRPSSETEMMVFITCISTVLGAWLGAVPIPLDWDRPWQVWPVSCILGTLFGHCIGLAVSAIYIYIQYRKCVRKIKNV